jgi:hypothetical protein
MPKVGKSLTVAEIHEAGPWSWLKAYFNWPRITDIRRYRCMERRCRRGRKTLGGGGVN